VFSASELLFGAFIVIGHNVFHIVPNESLSFVCLGSRQSGYAMAVGRRWDSNDQHRGGASS
jgi:hypothetical protein